jgi:hypothetical protein
MFSYEAPPLDLEIVESPSRIFRWGHQMVSGINELITVKEYNFILVDPLFVYTCRQLWLGSPGIIVGFSMMNGFIDDGFGQSCEASPVAKTYPPMCIRSKCVTEAWPVIASVKSVVKSF